MIPTKKFLNFAVPVASESSEEDKAIWSNVDSMENSTSFPMS